MPIIINIMADAFAFLLILFGVVLGGLFLSGVIMLILPTSMGKKDLGGIIIRVFSMTALLKLAGVTAVRAVVVTIVVMAIYLFAFGWAGKRALEIAAGQQPTHVQQQVELSAK